MDDGTKNLIDHKSIQRKINEALESLPPLSPSTLKILEIANNLNASPRDLMNIIKVDPVLTGKILRLVNSTYLSLSQKVTSLNRALILLGFNTIKNIALSTAVIDSIAPKGKNSYFDFEDLWYHMLSLGVTSKLIAKKAGQPKQLIEEFFIAGLLYDIGYMILMKYLGEEFQQVVTYAEQNKLSVSKACEKLLSTDSSQIGMLLARHWKLPENLLNVISKNQPSNDDKLYLSQIVHLADKYCRAHHLGYVSDSHNTEISEEELEEIGLDKNALSEISEVIDQEIEKAKVFIS